MLVAFCISNSPRPADPQIVSSTPPDSGSLPARAAVLNANGAPSVDHGDPADYDDPIEPVALVNEAQARQAAETRVRELEERLRRLEGSG